MLQFLALLGTPSLALANLSMAYALTMPACSHQAVYWLHLACGLSLLMAMTITTTAWLAGARGAPAPAEPAIGSFLWRVAVPVSALATLTIAAQWLCVFVLSPCLA